tara:strand:+ start:1375 stop:1626 length:252 start_codon:yes stop_codon:yes gene_type:complete
MGFPADYTVKEIMKKNGFTSFGEPIVSRFGEVQSVASGVAEGDELSILLDEMLIFSKNKHILNGTPEDLKAGILKIFGDKNAE